MLEDVPPELMANAWIDIQPDVIGGTGPLGKALIELAELMEVKNRVNADLGDCIAAPVVVIFSGGMPTVWDEETGHCVLQSLEDLTKDVERAKSISFDVARSVRAVVVLAVDEGSTEEELLFSLAHGSRTIPVESLHFHVSDNVDCTE